MGPETLVQYRRDEDKIYVQSPEGDYYYFKKSYKKEVINYVYEFWSEIIAGEIGEKLGFNMLHYDVAMTNEQIGCICKSMITDEQELNEGGKYLTAYDTTFDPGVKSTRSQYSFQLIQETFTVFGLARYIDNVIEMLVFDALIGNSDRHQENWAFITKVERNEIWNVLQSAPELVKLLLKNVEFFSPVYDSGSSLGRELEDIKVEQMITNKQQLDAYVERGKAEIHWNGNKVSHFALLDCICAGGYKNVVKEIIQRTISKFDKIEIESIISEVDNLVPEKLNHYRLPDSRKHLIYKLITTRFQKLRALIQ